MINSHSKLIVSTPEGLLSALWVSSCQFKKCTQVMSTNLTHKHHFQCHVTTLLPAQRPCHRFKCQLHPGVCGGTYLGVEGEHVFQEWPSGIFMFEIFHCRGWRGQFFMSPSFVETWAMVVTGFSACRGRATVPLLQLEWRLLVLGVERQPKDILLFCASCSIGFIFPSSSLCVILMTFEPL